MSRRVSLPGADELFRTTGGMPLQASSPRRPAGAAAEGEAAPESRVPGPAGEGEPARRGAAATAGASSGSSASGASPEEHGAAAGGEPGDTAERSRGRAAAEDEQGRNGGPAAARAAARAAKGAGGAAPAASAAARRGRRAANRRPSGRERHDEKITVYVSAEELMDLEHARLVLRGEHGLAVDRGRIVREAVAVVLADLESRGEASILVRRLRGR